MNELEALDGGLQMAKHAIEIAAELKASENEKIGDAVAALAAAADGGAPAELTEAMRLLAQADEAHSGYVAALQVAADRVEEYINRKLRG